MKIKKNNLKAKRSGNELWLDEWPTHETVGRLVRRILYKVDILIKGFCAWAVPFTHGPHPNLINNKYDGSKLSPELHWHDPDATRQTRIDHKPLSETLRRPTSVYGRESTSAGHDYSESLSDKGLTLAVTMISETLGNPSTRKSPQSFGLVQDPTWKNLGGLLPTALREYCDKNYHQLLPIIAKKVHQENVQQEKLKTVKSHLNLRRSHNTPSQEHRAEEGTSRKGSDLDVMKALSETAGSAGGHWKSKPKRQKSSIEDDMSQPWVCEETDPFTPWIHYFDFLKTRMPSHIKTYDGSEDPEDHLKIFQAAAKTERWAMPTWCHMFNSTLPRNARVRFNDLPQESIDSYDDLKKAFLENYLQQKKCIKDPVEIYNIKQRDGESTKEFMWRYNLECRDVKGATECIKISGFMQGITNPELIKRLHDKIPKLVDEMMRVTTTFLRVISFPPLGEEDQTEGPMIITVEIRGHFVHRMYVVGCSSSEILYEHCFNRFHQEIKNQMFLATTPLVRFSREIIWSLGQISPLNHRKVGSKENSGSSVYSSRNAKIPSDRRNGHITEQHDYSTRVQMGLGLGTQQPVIDHITEEKIQVAIHLEERWKELCGLLRRNLDIFAWKLADMTGVSRYHQIKMAKEDEEKTTFITIQGIFCYSKMSFGLKNVGATYQRLVDKAFQKQIRRNLEVYVHDLVIKSRMKQEVIRDIKKTFKTLREINMKLNPKKCTFGMKEGTFLGYKVNADGLKTAKAKTAFKQMKKLIAKFPMLTAPKEKEELIIYLAAANEAISVVLMTEMDGKQVPIYFVSHALQGLEINYTLIEKMILALILSNPKVTRRLLKWSFELEEHDINYRLRLSVKGQILADFIVKHPEDDLSDTPMEDEKELSDPWILFTDRSSCIDGSRGSLILTNLEGMKFTYALRFRFDATNNEADYKALIAGLRITEQMGVKNLQANVRTLTITFKEFTIKHVPRGENKKSDALSKMASTSFDHHRKQVLVEELKEKSTDEKEVLAVVEEEEHTWMTSIHEYLTEEILPEEKRKVKAIRRKAGSPPRAKEPAAELDPHHISMAILQVRDRHSWTFPGRSWQSQVPDNCGFGLPRKIISENEKQFGDNPFKDWYEKLCIRQCFASVKHPQANGLVERANMSLAMTPVEIGMPTLRTVEVDMIKNDKDLEINIDLLEERKERAAIQEAKSKDKMEKYYNARVRNTSFKPGDLVYRNNKASHAEDGGKLGPK
uniref:Reverse transcriptase domain-containing protein n=1 Tax=Tanacetum cinerariifolium TaxID=118510 RepID=A0A6L2L1H5_TANCI|nr:hypothetical protein [Tanacetum cinerariifolium]